MVNEEGRLMSAASNAETRKVKSVSNYLFRVDQIIRTWAPDREFDPWFRGHGDATWPLVPSLYRQENKKLVEEDDFREDFRRRAWPYLASTATAPNSEWEWYFLMQHYGLPTRLLDWSESSMVALYFALNTAKKKVDPAVWILDPWKLNKWVARRGDVVLSPSEKQVKRYLADPFEKDKIPRLPIALEPPLKSARIAAQRGVFTLHGRSAKALDNYAVLKPRLTKIVIAAGNVPEMKEQLRVAGLTETAVFPELGALCRELLEFWRYKPA
jgi:hypothetical protein